MTNKFSIQPLLDASDDRVQYVNLDARFLIELAAEMDGDEEPDEQSVRLRVIAQRLEHLDEQVRNLTGSRPSLDSIIHEMAKDKLANDVAWAQEGGVYNDFKADYTIESYTADATELVGRIRKAIEPDIYAAGIIEGKRRYLQRSNLPLQSVELTPDLRKAVANATVPVKKIPSGKPRPEIKPSPLAIAGIKLNLSFGKKDA